MSWSNTSDITTYKSWHRSSHELTKWMLPLFTTFLKKQKLFILNQKLFFFYSDKFPKNQKLFILNQKLFFFLMTRFLQIKSFSFEIKSFSFSYSKIFRNQKLFFFNQISFFWWFLHYSHTFLTPWHISSPYCAQINYCMSAIITRYWILTIHRGATANLNQTRPIKCFKCQIKQSEND